MAQLLKLSDNELTRLARSAVLVRQRDPLDSRAFVYPAWENVRRYALHGRARKEGAHTKWLREKSKAARVQRRRAELEMAIAKGRLVNKEDFFQEMAPRFIKVRHAMEEALAVGVPRITVDRILGFLQDANEGIGESSTNGDGSANGLTVDERLASEMLNSSVGYSGTTPRHRQPRRLFP